MAGDPVAPQPDPASLIAGRLAPALLELSAGGSLTDAATVIGSSLRAAVPAGRAVVELLVEGEGLWPLPGPDLPAAFVAACYPLVPGPSAATAVPGAPDPVGDARRRAAAACGWWGASWAPAVVDGRVHGAVAVLFEAGPADPGAVAEVVRAVAQLWATVIDGVRRRRELIDDGQHRNRTMADDLHGDALQELVVVDLGLQRLAAGAPDPGAEAVRERTRAACRSAIGSLRGLMARLDPSAGEGALTPGLLVRRLAASVLTPHGIDCEVRDDPAPPLARGDAAVVAALLGELFATCRDTSEGSVVSGAPAVEVVVARRGALLDVSLQGPSVGVVDAAADPWRRARVLASSAGGTLSVSSGASLAAVATVPLLG